MIIKEIEGAWYGEALPSGAYAFTAFNKPKLYTHLGTFDVPKGGGPLYTRISKVGVFRAVGQAADEGSNLTQEYIDGHGWRSTSPGPFGVSGAIYDNNGFLQVATPQSGIGVNGWRYVTPDNYLVTGDATYFSPTLRINQFTILPNGMAIGQNNDDSGYLGLVVCTPDGVKRQLYAGDCQMPRSNADNDGNVAIAFYVPSPGSATAVILQTTYAELQGLPPVPSTPTSFHHDVLIAPFKGPVPDLPSAEDIGVYSEADDVAPALAQAIKARKRVTWGYDAPGPVPVPALLRPAYDQIWMEAYRLKSESLMQSVDRWTANLDLLLMEWDGIVGIIPMMYCQGGAPPHELWTVDEVLAGLEYLPTLVNTSPRVQVVAPFAYNRANGIVAHPELQAALDRIVAASPGTPTFVPIPAPPIPPIERPSSLVVFA